LHAQPGPSRLRAPQAAKASRAFPARRGFRYHVGEQRRGAARQDGISGAMSDNDKRGNNGENPTTGVIIKARPKVRKPSMYKVLMLNDDYTPMEFVVHVLERFFNKSREEATRIMLHVHRRGVGVCGVYTYEVAETKVTQVMDLARQHQHPLQCTIEKE
jgi:ATP-dependent Clp protease adaptor protein ClpS